MISQIRIYTINKGEMDNFLKHFKEDIIPLHEKIGVPITGAWVNRPQNEFIWVRTYKDKAELEAKTKEFQAAVAAAGVKLGGNVAKNGSARGGIGVCVALSGVQWLNRRMGRRAAVLNELNNSRVVQPDDDRQRTRRRSHD